MVLQSLWAFLLPLLFLPNLGVGGATPFGTLEISDVLIVPFLTSLLITRHRFSGIFAKRVVSLGLLFILWALAGVLLIYLRFPYEDPAYWTNFSLLKLCKFSLYSAVGICVCAVAADEENRKRLDWSLLATCVVYGIGVMLVPRHANEAADGSLDGYKAVNSVSAGMSMLICYVGGTMMQASGSARWRMLAKPGLLCLLGGIGYTQGRGGWVGAIAGLLYLYYHRGVKLATVISFFACVAAATALYFWMPDFKLQVDNTFFPSKDVLAENIGVLGMDDGGRTVTLLRHIPVLGVRPVLGSGFHHRGGLTGIDSQAAHNFWMEIALETGFVGLALCLGVMWVMWRQAGLAQALSRNLTLPVRAALLAGFVAVNSGEYFYGSTTLLMLFLIYAPVGSLLGVPPGPNVDRIPLGPARCGQPE